MKSCICAPLDSPIEAPRPSFYDIDESKKGTSAPTRLARNPSKLQTTMEVTKCRFGNTSRQAAPIGFEEFVPRKDWTPIAHAVYHDREGALHHFLQNGISPDDTEGTGIPLLAIAAACDHFEITKILLEAGAHVNASSKATRETTLHVAVKGGRHDIIELLLEYRADLEARTCTGATPLHYAAACPGSLALVMKLLKLGANHDVNDEEGHTPAMVALQANNLHAAVAIINMTRGKPNQLAKEKGMLLERVEKSADRASVTNDLIVDVFTATCHPDSTVLVEAIKKNDVRLVEMFLERGADPHRTNARGLLPIFVAVKFAELRIIKTLVQHGADVIVRGPDNLDVLQVLLKSSSAHSEDSVVSTVDYLLAKGADGLALCSDGKTLLHCSVSTSTDQAKVVLLLLKNGIDINAQDDDGNTALHLAAHNGLSDAVRVMLDAHANTIMVDSVKRTPLLRAVSKQRWNVVRMLAFSTAMTSWDAEGSTALHYIAQSIPQDKSCWEEIATATKAFCERGVCRSMRDRSGATPLILAIKTLPEGGLAVVQALLAKGDQKWNCVGHEDHKRRDALYYAATLGKPTFVKILLEYGAPLVLKEWTESKKQLNIPAASKHQVLELLIEAERSRNLLSSQNVQNSTQETGIEITQTQLRTVSALSGYGADCETEPKLKPNRSNLRDGLSMQHTPTPTQHRKLAPPSSKFPARITSKQQRFGAVFGESRSAIRSHAVLDRTGHANAGTSQAEKWKDTCVEVTTSTAPGQEPTKSNVAFPARASSWQQRLMPIASERIKPGVPAQKKETSLSHMEPKASPKLPTTGSAAAAELYLQIKAPHAPPNQQHTPVESMPPVTKLAAASVPKLTSPTSISFAKTVTIPTTDANQDSAKSVKSDSSISPTPSLAALELLTSEKPNQPARVDSGVNITQNGAIKVPPMLDRSKTTLDGGTSRPTRQSGDELASWLAISSMLDKL